MEFRHELKFLVSEITLEKIRYRLENVMEKDSNQKGESYRIRSLYFDDIYDSCYNENLAGTDDRAKYRIRFYGDKIDSVKLEKKSKLRGMTKKLSEELTPAQVKDILEGDFVPTTDNISMELFAKKYKSDMKPKCIVEYDRCAFVEPTGNVRITFDMNIRGSKETEKFLDLDGEYAIPVVMPGWHILEVKYDEVLPRHILQLLDMNNLQRQSFSKYAMVREKLG